MVTGLANKASVEKGDTAFVVILSDFPEKGQIW